jgi:hypothetical protein
MDPVAGVGEGICGRTQVRRDAEPRNHHELPAVRATDDVGVQPHLVDHRDHGLAGQLVLLVVALE